MKTKFSCKKEEWLFITYFVLVTIGKSIGLDADSLLLQFITLIAFLFLAAKLLTTKYTVKEVIIIAILIILGLLLYFTTKREGVLLSILTISGLKGVSYKKLFTVVFKVRVIAYISLITLASLGIINNVACLLWKNGIGYITRYGLGYSHPNMLHANLFMLVILYTYLNYEKLRTRHYLIIMILNIIIYNLSTSRTGFYMTTMVVFGAITIKSKFGSRFCNKIFIMILPISLIFSLYSALYYSKAVIIKTLDTILTGRIYFSNYFLTHYPIKLFGYNLSNETKILDNGYFILLLNYGAIIFGLYVFGYLLITKKMIRLGMKKELLIISCFTVYGITESYIPNVFLNLSLIFMGDLLFNQNRKLDSTALKNIITHENTKKFIEHVISN